MSPNHHSGSRYRRIRSSGISIGISLSPIHPIQSAPPDPISRTIDREFPKRGSVARKPEHEQQHVIEEIESIAERGAQWIRDHLPLTIATLLIVLGTAAAIGALAAHRTRQAEAASDAFDRVSAEFMRAMGADPDDLDGARTDPSPTRRFEVSLPRSSAPSPKSTRAR